MNSRLDAILFDPISIVPFQLGWGWQRVLQARLLADSSGPEALLFSAAPRLLTPWRTGGL